LQPVSLSKCDFFLYIGHMIGAAVDNISHCDCWASRYQIECFLNVSHRQINVLLYAKSVPAFIHQAATYTVAASVLPPDESVRVSLYAIRDKLTDGQTGVRPLSHWKCFIWQNFISKDGATCNVHACSKPSLYAASWLDFRKGISKEKSPVWNGYMATLIPFPFFILRMFFSLLVAELVLFINESGTVRWWRCRVRSPLLASPGRRRHHC